MLNETRNGKRILVIEEIEDDELIRSVIHQKLHMEGFDVIDAKDGEEGLKTALREHPDLILLDIMMPKMDGVEMMKKLREADMWGKKVPVIFLTNLSADDERINTAVAESEPAFYFEKASLSMEDLVAKIRERLAVE